MRTVSARVKNAVGKTPKIHTSFLFYFSGLSLKNPKNLSTWHLQTVSSLTFHAQESLLQILNPIIAYL